MNSDKKNINLDKKNINIYSDSNDKNIIKPDINPDINNFEYSDLIKNSFQITYVLLITTATITIIEALRTNNAEVRHILNLETCISIIAGYFYSLFIIKVEDYKSPSFNWNTITRIRYIDWSITTPLMLLVLCLVLSMHSNKKVNLFTFIIIVILNYTMLYLGYIGETGAISRISSCILGFIAFFAMFYIIFICYVHSDSNGKKYNMANYVLFTLYILIWSLYGVVFMFPEETKNTVTNFLDLTAKCLIGLGLWAYYTEVLTI